MQHSLKPVEEQDIQTIDCTEPLTIVCDKLYMLTGYKVELEQLGDFIAKQYMREPSVNITTIITNNILIGDVFNIGCDSFRNTPKHSQFYREVEYQIDLLVSRISNEMNNGTYYGFSEGKIIIVHRKLNVNQRAIRF